MQLDSIKNCKKKKKKAFLVAKIKDYNLTKQKYFNISNCIKIKRSNQTKFYMQLNSIRNCKKKKKKREMQKNTFLVVKNRELQLNQAKTLRI